MRVIHKLVGGGVAMAAGVAMLAGPAFANDCANFSRTAPPCYYTQAGCTTLVASGHWAFLPSLVPGDPTIPPIWVFNPPANFTNGQSDALTFLANTKSGGAVCATPNRQFTGDLSTLHGVISTAACFGF